MSDKKLIFLCGFMGCGKTTQGKQLAKQLGYHFIDLDDYTANKFDKDITELFKEVGEEEFRTIEKISLQECIDNNMKTVIALGGGTPCFNNTIDILKQHGLLVYIQMNAIDLYNRLFQAKVQRPLLENKLDAEMLNYIEHLLAIREPIYKQAHVQINGNQLKPEELKHAVLDYLSQQ